MRRAEGRTIPTMALYFPGYKLCRPLGELLIFQQSELILHEIIVQTNENNNGKHSFERGQRKCQTIFQFKELIGKGHQFPFDACNTF